MKLWTLQPIEWYDKLCRNGIICGESKHIELTKEEENFDYAYDWMIQEMKARIGDCKNVGDYPIWAWYQYENHKKRRPDLRCSGFFEKGTKAVRIEFEKAEQDVLLSDFDLWLYVLNYWYIPDTEEESLHFDKLLEESGVNFIDKEDYTPEMRQLVEDSWTKIFDMNYSSKDLADPFEKKSIQATFWQLSVDDITKVDYFTAR